MAYEKQTWKTGDVITETKLNHMEDGIASSGGESNVFVVGVSEVDDNVVLDKTWEQIEQEVESGKIGFILAEDDGFFINVITEVFQLNGVYIVTALTAFGASRETYIYKYTTQQPSDYPVEEPLS